MEGRSLGKRWGSAGNPGEAYVSFLSLRRVSILRGMSSSSPKKQATGRQIGTFVLALILALCGGGALMAGIALPFVMTMGTTANAVTGIFDDVPEDLGFTEPSEQTVLLAKDGSVLARFYIENRINVRSDQISQHMKNAVVAIEDRRFYEHHGIDVQGTVSALVSNLTSGGLSGGSSITQQYVKNALLEEGRIADDNEKIKRATEQTIARKINEARYAIAVEKTMTKDEILTGYLNLAQFGPSQYGVETAAQRYFSKSAKDLTVVEAATMAGITQNPAQWDPVRHPEANTERRNVVLGEMYRSGFITEAEMKEAQATPIESYMHVSEQSAGCGSVGISAYFCEYVVKDLLNDKALGATRAERTRQLYRGGKVIRTTLDSARQQQAYDSVVTHQPVDDASGIDAALVSVEPGSGHIVSMVQNTRFGVPNDTDTRMTQVNVTAPQDMGGGAGFQSGSTFKIFTLVEWLDSGRSAYDVVDSSEGLLPQSSFQASCTNLAGEPWPVGNLGQSNRPRTVLEGTRMSTNGTFAHMAQKLDLCQIANKAQAMGVERGDHEPFTIVPPMILGTNNVTPLSMATAGATLANDGIRCDPMSYTSIEEHDGTVISERKPQCQQAISKETARKTNAVLQHVVEPGATGEKAALRGRQVAGKTGTSDKDWHAWFMGYTPQLATVTWQGHMEGNISMFDAVIKGQWHSEVYGGLFPAMMFSDYMNAALAGQPAVPFPQPTTPMRRPAPAMREPATPSPSPTPAPAPAQPAPGEQGAVPPESVHEGESNEEYEEVEVVEE